MSFDQFFQTIDAQKPARSTLKVTKLIFSDKIFLWQQGAVWLERFPQFRAMKVKFVELKKGIMLNQFPAIIILFTNRRYKNTGIQVPLTRSKQVFEMIIQVFCAVQKFALKLSHG